MTKTDSLLSPEELNALIGQWGDQGQSDPDRYAVVRFWLLVVITLVYGYVLLFNTTALIHADSNSAIFQKLQVYLYIRGWFLLAMVSIGVYAYIRNSYYALVMLVLFGAATINFFSDLALIYADWMNSPTAGFTVFLMLRLLAMLMLFQSVRNANRLPTNLRDRLSLWAFLKNKASDTP